MFGFQRELLLLKQCQQPKRRIQQMLARSDSDDAVRFILEFIFWLLQLLFFYFVNGRHDADIITDIFMLTHVQFNGKNDEVKRTFFCYWIGS